MNKKHLFEQLKIFGGCATDSVTHREGFWESLQRFREEENIEAADIDPDEIFKDVRDPSPGRDIVL